MINIPTVTSPNLSLDTQPQTTIQPQFTQQQVQQQYSPQPINTQSNQGVSLKKGQKVSLNSMSNRIRVGLGWDASYFKNIPYDIDSEVFMLGSNEKVLGDNWFVFYGNLRSPDGSIVHNGDNMDGRGTGDDETIDIALSLVSPLVSKLVFIITIHEAKKRGHNFGQIKNTFIRICDLDNNKELVRFSLTEYYPTVYAMVVGEIYRYKGEWKFNPIGDGTADDLEGLCKRYGVNVE